MGTNLAKVAAHAGVSLATASRVLNGGARVVSESLRARVLAAAGALEQTWLMPDAARYNVDRHSDRVKHNGDVPLVTPILRGIDSAAAVGSTATRPVRDPTGSRTAPPIVIQPADKLVEPAPSPADQAPAKPPK